MEETNSSTYNVTGNVNITMPGHDILEDPCGSPDLRLNVSACKQTGLGISLATPVAMFTTGILGNILALVVLYTSKKEAKKTVFYTLLAGLGWTDLIGQLLTSPVAIAVYANNMQWVGGEPLCKYHAFVMIFFACITPLLVCAMSLERILALKFTYFYARTVTRRKAEIMITGCWIFVFIFCTLPLMGFGSYELQFPKSWCFLNFHKESEVDVAYASTFAILNITVILTNLCCNLVVVATLLKMRKKRLVITSPSLQRRQGTQKTKSPKKKETETQMVVFLCAITTVFTICCLPLNINILVNQITGHTNRKADLMGVRLASINQILDPWLYILMRKALIYKIFRYIKHWLCYGRLSPSKPAERSLHSYENVDVENAFPLGTIQNCGVKVVCHAPMEKDDDSQSDRSDSVSSTSNLLQCPYLSGSATTTNGPESNVRYSRSLSADDSAVVNNNDVQCKFLSKSCNSEENTKQRTKTKNNSIVDRPSKPLVELEGILAYR
ncbi:hypothetical protein FSP39_023360 [Pinctada imbricata]|uniref:Prostaglandin E2 receptor EP4 subtype n=1 Tax=Pinctada imbricata TaxID=66713 RepID=A0AA88XT60_PINIB|nr:hypothetical protein FSP39_023360 [Pinctada imbricata]